MFRNSAKGNALLDEVGWKLHTPGDIGSWDGLTSWVVAYFDADPALKSLPIESTRHRGYIQSWAKTSKRALATD